VDSSIVLILDPVAREKEVVPELKEDTFMR
jgi:hypothetical protein